VSGAPPRPRRTARPARDLARGPAITVRAATAADLAVVIELRLALLHEHRENILYARLRKDAPARARRLFATQLASPDEVTLLAIAGNVAVGVLRCMHARGYPLLEPAHYAYVSSVYVVPDARRRGVLRAMLAEAERWCTERGLTEIRLHSVAGHELSNQVWDVLGFEVVEQLRLRPVASPPHDG
jgi:GNAT superfamily N-acetyltransferase